VLALALGAGGGAPSSEAAPDETIRFQPSAFEWIPWADSIEAAKARAKDEGKLVLAFAFAWDAKAYEDGYEGAEAVRAMDPTPAAQAEAQRSRDPGFVKEQAAFVAWLCDPDVAALVARAFVPVRLRLHTWHFFDVGPPPFVDPLTRLGTSDRETQPPAVVVAKPDGRLVARFERIGVFEPRSLHRLLLAALRDHPKPRPPKTKAPPDFRAGVLDRIEAGDVSEARKRLATPPPADAAWAAVETARLDAIEGSVEPAAKALDAMPASAERDVALAEVELRRGMWKEALDAAGSHRDPAAKVVRAMALERLGKEADARKAWKALLDASPRGPVAARATLHLAGDGPRALEWDTPLDVGLAATATSTVTGKGGPATAVRYLLSQQDADGAWRDARWTPGAFDLAVPRTALCVSALRAWRDVAPGKALDDAIARGTEFVTSWSERPSDQVWHLTYALHLELELLADKPTEKGRKRARGLLEALSRIEHDGGWSYMPPPRLHTFNTAPVLLLLVRAKDLKLPVDAAQIERAAKFLEANRVPKTHVFHYAPSMVHMSGEKGKSDEKSTAMRTPACELALLASGAAKNAKGVADALDLYLDNAAAARATQKIFESYVDVTSFQDSYRWFFGAWYAAQGVARLPDAKRKKTAEKIEALVLAEQEADGSFVDSQMVGKTSSTALALLALSELRPSLR
jgi:hypothetical protein